MRRIAAATVFATLIAPMVWTAGAHAQEAGVAAEAGGTIDGRVFDANNVPLEGVPVSARSHETGATLHVKTDANGAYAITNIAPGVYDVTASGPHESVRVITGVTVQAGTSTNADVTLPVASNPAPPPTPPAPEGDPSKPTEETATASTEEKKEEPGPRINIYGFAMLDAGFQFLQNDPAWFDVARPSKLPSTENEFGEDNHWFMGVRQSRLGVKTYIPTPLGEGKGIFEFELFGTGVDEGQTTFRLRHAWGELSQIGAGQTWSPFMDPDVFPNSIEYWGPPGMVFFRNVQLRWMPVKNDLLDLNIAIERPGASADTGSYAERIELQGVTGRFPAPDLSAHARLKGDWGHAQLAGILRYIAWDDVVADDEDISGYAIGWGLNASSNIKFWQDTVRLQVVFGYAIGNYLNDGAVDVGVEVDQGEIEGVSLPVLGIVAFYDRTWSDQFTSTIGYSLTNVWNSEGQAPDAFQTGQYALANLLYKPVPNLMLGPEVQWVWRGNKSNDFDANDVRIQVSVKYSWDFELKGEVK